MHDFAHECPAGVTNSFYSFHYFLFLVFNLIFKKFIAGIWALEEGVDADVTHVAWVICDGTGVVGGPMTLWEYLVWVMWV